MNDASTTKEPAGAATISIVMPVWRESDALLDFLREIMNWPEVGEVIVALAEETPESRTTIEATGCSAWRPGDPTAAGR